MGFFSGPEEDARRRNLTDMENKRLAFAGEMARVGFAPERICFCPPSAAIFWESAGTAARCA